MLSSSTGASTSTSFARPPRPLSPRRKPRSKDGRRLVSLPDRLDVATTLDRPSLEMLEHSHGSHSLFDSDTVFGDEHQDSRSTALQFPVPFPVSRDLDTTTTRERTPSLTSSHSSSTSSYDGAHHHHHGGHHRRSSSTSITASTQRVLVLSEVNEELRGRLAELSDQLDADARAASRRIRSLERQLERVRKELADARTLNLELETARDESAAARKSRRRRAEGTKTNDGSGIGISHQRLDLSVNVDVDVKCTVVQFAPRAPDATQALHALGRAHAGSMRPVDLAQEPSPLDLYGQDEPSLADRSKFVDATLETSGTPASEDELECAPEFCASSPSLTMLLDPTMKTPANSLLELPPPASPCGNADDDDDEFEHSLGSELGDALKDLERSRTSFECELFGDDDVEDVLVGEEVDGSDEETEVLTPTPSTPMPIPAPAIMCESSEKEREQKADGSNVPADHDHEHDRRWRASGTYNDDGGEVDDAPLLSFDSIYGTRRAQTSAFYRAYDVAYLFASPPPAPAAPATDKFVFWAR